MDTFISFGCRLFAHRLPFANNVKAVNRPRSEIPTESMTTFNRHHATNVWTAFGVRRLINHRGVPFNRRKQFGERLNEIERRRGRAVTFSESTNWYYYYRRKWTRIVGRFLLRQLIYSPLLRASKLEERSRELAHLGWHVAPIKRTQNWTNWMDRDWRNSRTNTILMARVTVGRFRHAF